MTKFLALDKCLPGRQFLQILEIGDDSGCEPGDDEIRLEYDPAWLSVLRQTDFLTSVKSTSTYMPGPGCGDRFEFPPEVDSVAEIFNGDFRIAAFDQNSASGWFDPEVENENIRVLLRSVPQPQPVKNAQTEYLCSKLDIRDPVDLLLNGSWPQKSEDSSMKQQSAVKNDAEIDLDDDDDLDDDLDDNGGNEANAEVKRPALVLPEPVHDGEEAKFGGDGTGFSIDTNPDTNPDANPDAAVKNPDKTDAEIPSNPKKKLKRRNQAIYSEEQD